MLSPPIMANLAFVPCLWTLKWSQLVPSITNNKFWNFIAGVFVVICCLSFCFFVVWALWSQCELRWYVFDEETWIFIRTKVGVLINFYFFNFMCMYVHMHAYHVYAGHVGVRRRIKIPLNQSYPGWLRAAMWMSETEPGSSAGAVSPLNHWISYLCSPSCFFCVSVISGSVGLR